VLSKAKSEWAIKGAEACLASDHTRFSHWFQNAVITTPIIAALVLNSGFAAHPYRFLQLIKTGDTIVTQSQFNDGVKYIAKLKSIGGSYIHGYVDTYRVDFVSSDSLVQARLLEIVHGKGVIHTAEPVWTNNPLYQPSV